MFSSTVTDHWFAGLDPGAVPETVGVHRVVVDSALPESRRISVLEPVGSGGILRLRPEAARELAVEPDDELTSAELAAALRRAGLRLHGADDLFYLPVAEQAAVGSGEDEAGLTMRELSAADAEAFAAFEQDAPEADRDEAFVELDHWLVFGAFAEGRLVSAASMYPWDGTTLADLGVITLPRFRGRGLARKTVRALSGRALELGYEPQYRCQLDNRPSIALAASAGFRLFGVWDVVG